MAYLRAREKLSPTFVLWVQVTFAAAAADLATRTEGKAFFDENLVLGPSSLTRTSPGTVIEQVTADTNLTPLPMYVRQEQRLRHCWHSQSPDFLENGTFVQEQNGARGSFNWQKNWYPVQLVKNLDAKASGPTFHAVFPALQELRTPTGVGDEDDGMLQVPYAFDLLGKRLVLWRDAEQLWRCFEDKCPHRCATSPPRNLCSDIWTWYCHSPVERTDLQYHPLDLLLSRVLCRSQYSAKATKTL